MPPTFNAKLKDIVAGDDVSLRRTVDRALTGLEAGVTITKAWFTAKAALADADPGLVQKSITTTNVPGTGQIENDGTGDVNPIVRFDLVPADTLAIGTTKRFFDVKVRTSGGLVHRVELGETIFKGEVTQVDS